MKTKFTDARQKSIIRFITAGLLTISFSFVTKGSNQKASNEYPIVLLNSETSSFKSNFFQSGKPKFSYTRRLEKKFGSSLNQITTPMHLQLSEPTRSQKVYQELLRVADRTVISRRELMIIDSQQARKWSRQYEIDGSISPLGAWSVAVGATAVRYGFANVPCAEFMSEVIRQAYQRAGVDLRIDFNKKKKNRLIHSETALVAGLSQALIRAGWIPWDTSQFRPKTGSIMMHVIGQSPGHAYLAAGHDGQIVIDNGYPQGKSLRTLSRATVDMMFKGGVFFLPPGIIPEKW